MNVGDYIRTNRGVIAKITRVNSTGSITCDRIIYFGTNIMSSKHILCDLSKIIKVSSDIIDLVFVGDVIRVFSDLHDLLGNELFEIRDEQHLKHLKDGFNKGYFHLISVVTKEQFEQMEYKV